MLLNILAVAGGGVIGALCRFGLTGLVNMLVDSRFKVGTILVNLVGCLLFGLFFSVIHNRAETTDAVRLFILTGFLGAFTTFSTYTFESVSYMIDGKFALAAANVLISTVVSLPVLYLGMKIGKML
ncbi:MAG: CrcB family protein [Sedimentisphaerales bacterium]|nr:CrcB family protein [Sedimentisphaerales bacterium]MBN2843281.1 CrcB family protein [Sedimentisphaerales bacterium]